MTESEAIEKLKAYVKCQKKQVKGIYENCNNKRCDNCDLCYAQGHWGEHIQSVETAISALEKQMNSGWIPIRTRPLTEEEKKEYAGYNYTDAYDCKMPNDEQEVLITTNYGTVEKTTYYTDYGCYFDGWEDDDEVIAWMPLPEPYKESE